MSQVTKYTGMARDEVKSLNEEFKQMDTRTAREQLNALAGDAGRLGIQSRDKVLEFVDAADKINVALGEDLGEDAVKNIGKLAQMFGEDETKGLRGAMLATGSAVNEVAQKSAASESFLVDFTARVAGVGNQAGLSQADIIGFAASMDEKDYRAERKRIFADLNNCNAIIETATDTLVAGCAATIIPDTVKAIGSSAFHNSYNLKSIVLPPAVSRVGAQAFSHCPLLREVHIPATLTSIGKEAFAGEKSQNTQ